MHGLMWLHVLAATLLIAATLPLVLELLVLSIAAALPQPLRARHSAQSLRLCVIIPAHNEEQLIAACVESLRSTSLPGVEICVVAHNCTDATVQAATQAGATVLELHDDGTGGKGAALLHGFEHALASNADAVLIIDADSTVSPNLIAGIRNAFAAGAHALQCRYVVANPSATTRTRLMSLSLLGMNVLRPRGRAQLGLSCGIFGNGFALSAATLRAVPYSAHSVVEDLEYHLLLVKAGLRVEFLDSAQVFGEMPDTSAASATQRARWEGGRRLMRRRWAGPLFREVMRGRFRKLEPLLDLLALPLASEVGLLLVALLVPLTWASEYAIFGLSSIIFYVLVAALLGESPMSTLAAIMFAPAYMLWKLTQRAETRRVAKGDAEWVRTKRNDSGGPHE